MSTRTQALNRCQTNRRHSYQHFTGQSKSKISHNLEILKLGKFKLYCFLCMKNILAHIIHIEETSISRISRKEEIRRAKRELYKYINFVA